MVFPARTSAVIMNAEEFLRHPLPDGKAELVRGELRVTPPASGPHGVASTNLVLMLGTFLRTHALGRAFADGIGYELLRLPHTVRVPDASYVRADRLPEHGVGPGLLKLAPDLAVEVLSPSETASDLEESSTTTWPRARHWCGSSIPFDEPSWSSPRSCQFGGCVRVTPSTAAE